jgi:hypothetical protein
MNKPSCVNYGAEDKTCVNCKYDSLKIGEKPCDKCIRNTYELPSEWQLKPDDSKIDDDISKLRNDYNDTPSMDAKPQPDDNQTISTKQDNSEKLVPLTDAEIEALFEKYDETISDEDYDEKAPIDLCKNAYIAGFKKAMEDKQ